MKHKNIQSAIYCYNEAINSLCKDDISEDLFTTYAIYEEEKKIENFIHDTYFATTHNQLQQ